MVLVKYSCLGPQPPTAYFYKMCALGVIVAIQAYPVKEVIPDDKIGV
jgi:hypothetical protein